MDDDDYLDIDLNFPILDEQVAELIEEKFNSKYFDLVNINKYPLIKKEEFEIDPPYLIIDSTNYSYHDAINNFIYNELIPDGERLYLNGVYYYIKQNGHGINTIFAYPSGYETLNLRNCFPYSTGAIQVSLMKQNTEHNERYNNQFQIKIKIDKDEYGNTFEKSNFIITAYVAKTKVQAIKQIIYLLEILYNDLRYPDYVTPTFDIMFTDEEGNDESIKKILEKNKNKFVVKIDSYQAKLNFIFEKDNVGNVDIF